MGTLAVIFCLSLKMAGLAGLPEEDRWVWLLAAPGLARTSQIIGLVFMDYARKGEGKSGLFFQKGKLSLLSLGIVPLTLPFLIGIQAGILATGFFLLCTALLLWFFQKKIGGITGDSLGALTEIVEAAVFIAGAVAARNL